MPMPVELIAKKRDGGELSPQEIGAVVQTFLDGTLADYQMSALLMAIVLRGMTEREVVALTEAMMTSGQTLSLDAIPGTKVDKHSTGGVGDKVSICLAPLVAACGVPVPMICGRGLGHTGGTLDKLEAIPGFCTRLDVRRFTELVGTVGTCIIGQTEELAPADRRMYALRDVTATVESVPLIVASILSKKLAEGIDALVLDVKTGRGAFMPTLARARALATMLVRVGKRAGKRVVALLTDMQSPLGRTVGNALETREAIELLHGQAPEDLLENTLALGEEMLLLGGRAKGRREARRLLRLAIDSGEAARKLEQVIEAQGGDPRVVSEPQRLPRAPLARELPSPRRGWIVDLDARELGLSAVALGAGRTRTDQPVDPSVGIELLVKRGDWVERGEPIARVHMRGPDGAVEARIVRAFRLGAKKPARRPLVLERLT